MSKIRRRGLRSDPPGGWPLDELLVGVATLRTIRELYRRERDGWGDAARAWDLSLWSGVTAQGSAESLARLLGQRLVTLHPPTHPERAAAFRLDRSHPLTAPLADLFAAERAAVRRRPPC